ncbi:MAG: hypothetical protein J5775_05420 [Spirochaetales bacterium]|nr:hypothetical protein [Spirochaetales bacterium]
MAVITQGHLQPDFEISHHLAESGSDDRCFFSQIPWDEAFWLKGNQPENRGIEYLAESEWIHGFSVDVFQCRTTGLLKKPVPVVSLQNRKRKG